MSFTLTSPFASISGEAIESLAECGDSGANPDINNDEVMLEFAGASSSYELEDLDPLSALEKYCRSDMPAQRLAYAAGIAAAVGDLEPSAVSGSLVSLLRELLGDVYADVRLTALQQVVPVARRLREPGMTYQSDIETLWDIVQPVLLDADVENQEAAAQVLAELTHLVACGNSVVAGQNLVWAVQRLQRLPQELLAEGALAALRLITEVVVPRPGSSLCFDAVQDFAVSVFKDMASYERSADVRQAVALLLPRFVRHMPAAVRATLLPGLLKTLASDTHWNVRAEVPDLLVNLVAVTQHTIARPSGQTQGLASSKSLSEMFDRSGGDPYEQQLRQQQHDVGESSHTAAAVDSAAVAVGAAAVDGFTPEECKVKCDVADKLCRDASHLVKVPALAALGQLLPLLPAADAAATKPNLLGWYASTAKPPAAIAGVRVPAQLTAPRLSGKVAVQRQRRQQQRRPGKAHQQQQQNQEAAGNKVHAGSSNCKNNDNSRSNSGAGEKVAFASPFANVAAFEPSSCDGDSSSSGDVAGSADSPSGKAAAAAVAETDAQAPVSAAGIADMAGAAGIDPALLDDEFHVESPDAAAAATGEVSDSEAAAAASEQALDPTTVAVASVAHAAGVEPHLLDIDLAGESSSADADKLLAAAAPAAEAAAADTVKVQEQLQQQQGNKAPAVQVAARGTAAAELPLACAFHIGKVVRHVGSHCWPVVQPAFVSLAAAAVAGDADIAAALLLSFPDLAAALGPSSTQAVLVPVMLELLHNQLEQLAPVLSVMLRDVTVALPPSLRICLLQLLPSLAIQPDREVAGDWRARLAVAQQLPAVAKALTPPQVAYCVWPLLLTLAKDPVHAVRTAAALQVGPLLMLLPDEEAPAEESAATDAAAAAAADAAEESAATAAAAVTAEQEAAAAGAGLPVTSDSIAALAAAGVAAADDSSDMQAETRRPSAAAAGAEADILAAATAVEASVEAAAAAATAADNNAELLTIAEQQQQAELLQQQQANDPEAASDTQQNADKPQWQQQQQQPRRSRLGKMKRGLLHGLQHLHQQLQDGIQQGVELVKESGGLQRALTEVDSQLQWLQQHPTGSVLHSIGQKISAAAAAAGGNTVNVSSSNSNAFFSLGELEGQLHSVDLIESVLDPCKYLPTPAWPALAVDLAALAKGSTSTERQAFVLAAGSILAAHKQRGQKQQQQHSSSTTEDASSTSGTTTDPAARMLQEAAMEPQQHQQQLQELQTMELDHLLQELQLLAGDSVPGVRCGVATVASKLLGVSETAAGGGSSSSSVSSSAYRDATSSKASTGTEELPSAAAAPAAAAAACDESSGQGIAALEIGSTEALLGAKSATPVAADVGCTEGAAAVGNDSGNAPVTTDAATTGIQGTTAAPEASVGDAELVPHMAAAAAPCDAGHAGVAAAQQVEPACSAEGGCSQEQAELTASENTSTAPAEAVAADIVPVSTSIAPAGDAVEGEAFTGASVPADVPGLPAGAVAVLQQCLQKLQRDPCLSVASVAGGRGVGAASVPV